MYTIVLVNVKRFRALCGFYAIENKLLLLLLIPLTYINYWTEHWDAEMQRAEVTNYVPCSALNFDHK